MARGKLVLILGGARSGKSSFAEKLAMALGQQVVYVATAAVEDEEMARRVARHRSQRPGQWLTVEETHRLSEVIEQYGKADVILVDCLTIWLANLISGPSFVPDDEREVLSRVKDLADTAKRVRAHVLLVSNEVGMGIVPDTPLGRFYRDMAGFMNQLLAYVADKVYFVMAGLPVELKSLSEPLIKDLQ